MATLAANALISLAQAKLYLKRDETTDDDEKIADFVDLVSAAIESYTHRKLLARTYDGTANNEPTMILSGRGSKEIAVREYPVTSVSEIVERYADGATTRTLSLTGMRLLHGGRRIWLPYDEFPAGQNNVEVKCVAGYAEATHPSDVRTLRLAAMRYLQVVWQDYELALGRGQTLSVGGESVAVLPDELPKDVKMMLRPFERWL